MTGRAYVHGRSADTSLAEICQETQKEKSFQGSHKLQQAHEKVRNENETNKGKTARA